MTGPAHDEAPGTPLLRIVATGSHRVYPPGRHSRAGRTPGPAAHRTGRADTPDAVTLSGPAPADARSVQTPRIVVPYLVTALISVLVVALVSVWVSRMVAAEDAVDGAIAHTRLAADMAVSPYLTDAAIAGDPAAVAQLDRVVRGKVLSISLVRVKVWDATGRILYSDESRLVGRRFPLGADELAALRSTDADASLSDLSAPENVLEDRTLPLLEVYLPLRTPAGVPVLFESYYRYDGVSEAAQRIWTRFVPLGVGALVLLELLQVPIAVVLARRLRRARAQREQMVRQSLSAVDDERRRIAGDLHDGVVQDLAGVAFMLGAASRTGAGRRIDPAQVADSADRVRRSVRALRSLLVEIYPPNLYEEGLHAALSDLVARLVPPTTELLLDVEEPLPVLDRPRTELVYRVVQEGLRNVERHAAASAVAVELGVDHGVLVLCVTDDGAGCDPDRLTDGPGGLGLRALGGMAAQQGAALLLDSAPGRGTVLRLEVPL